MESLKERLLKYYSWDEEEFAANTREPSFSSFPDLSGDEEAEKARGRILSAAKRKEKVLLYGDYDTDGIMGTSILHAALRRIGIDAAYFIPSRYVDGYGLNQSNAERIAKAGYSLVLLVDNGVGCRLEIGFLKGKGVDVIVIDHHSIVGEPPSCCAFLHPLTLGIGKGGFNISAGLLSFFFSRLILGVDDPYLLCLGAVSTLSDMMPLTGINREAVRLALKILEKDPYPELALLCSGPKIDEKALQMEAIPAINALGRMEEGHLTRRAVAYFSLRDPSKRLPLSSWMKEINQRRKEMTKQAVASLPITPGASGICVKSSLKEGLNGLLANRLMKLHRVPVAVFSPSYAEEGVLVGSLRSEEGFSVLDCFSALSPYLLRCGGHERAGGLSLKEGDFPSFQKSFLSYCKEHPFSEEEDPGIPLRLSECTEESYSLLRQFAPFGQGHEEPVFVLSNLDVDSFQYSKDGKYLLTPLGYGVKMVSFSLGKKDFLLKSRTSLYARFVHNEYKGKQSLEIRVSSSSRNG